MTPTGYKAENTAWKPFLTRPDPSLGERHDGTPRLAGLDPMKIPPATLIMAGHPNRANEALRSALCNYDHGDPVEALSRVRAYRDIPAYCNGCAGDALSRRKCAVINCPFWAYRHGRNPHSPRRGIKPAFAVKKPSVGTNCPRSRSRRYPSTRSAIMSDKYPAAIYTEILIRISEGESLGSICSEPDMPSRATVYEKVRGEHAFAKSYSEAIKARAQSRVDEMMRILGKLEQGLIDPQSGSRHARYITLVEQPRRSDTLRRQVASRVNRQGR